MEQNKIKKLPNNVFNALKKILLQISKSEMALPQDNSIWSFFIDKVDTKKLTPTIKNIRDYFTKDDNIDCNMFKFFEKLFREVGSLDEKSGDVTRTILTKVASNDNCLELILENQDFYSTIVKNAGNDAENLLVPSQSLDYKRNIIEQHKQMECRQI